MENNDFKPYEAPAVTDYGTLEQLTAVVGNPIVSDVPGGTQTAPGQDGAYFSS